MFVIEINRWFYIKHSRRNKYYRMKYWKEEAAKDQLIKLQKDLKVNPGYEDRMVTDLFNVGPGSCEPAIIHA
jgi:hypothetical protein